MKALKLYIHLDEPLLVTGVANGEENSSTSLSYIPGSTIRGQCIAAYLRQAPPTQDLLADELARELFFANKVFFLNGYPAYPLDRSKRALPRLLSWHTAKDDLGNNNREVWDFALEEHIMPFEYKSKTPKQDAREFFWQDQNPVPLFTPLRKITLHNASKQATIKRRGESSVFRYEALAANQDFVAFVISEDENLLAEVQKYLPDGINHYGGSQTAGYGLVTISKDAPIEWEWDEGEAEVDYDVDEYTIITLLSHTILRTATGQSTTDFHAVLQSVLGKPSNWSKPKHIFANAQLVGGFNRKWGLPLPQRWALAMGSTYVYDADELPPEELSEMIATGIGERRDEGFGRIGVNLNAKSTFQSTIPYLTPVARVPLSPESIKLARQMARRRFMSEVRAAIPTYTRKIRFRGQPENAQLSRLRLIVRQAKQKQEMSLITRHLNDLRLAQEQFTRRYLDVPGGVVSWDNWLRGRVKLKDSFSLLQLEPEAKEFTIAGENAAAEATALQTLRLETLCMLMDAVLRKAMKS